MKTKRAKRQARLMFRLTSYGSYIDKAYQLERILAEKPARLRIEMVGSGEIPPDSALLIRSILLARSPRTRVSTVSRSSLEGGSALVWLLGDIRQIRDDAQLFFRAAGPFESDDGRRTRWKDWDEFDDDLEDAAYIRVLEAINQFLPVKDLAGRPFGVPVLKQFGLVENEKLDTFLAAAFQNDDTPKKKRRPRLKAPR